MSSGSKHSGSNGDLPRPPGTEAAASSSASASASASSAQAAAAAAAAAANRSPKPPLPPHAARDKISAGSGHSGLPPPSLLPHDRSTSIGEESDVSALSNPGSNDDAVKPASSFVSALSSDGELPAELGPPAPSPEPGTRKGGGSHKRNVSWGFAAKNILAPEQSTKTLIFQPDLGAADGGGGSGSLRGYASPNSGNSGGTPPVDLKPKPRLSPAPSGRRLQYNQSQRHVRKNTGRISLSEVAASPLEDEAETAIIRALEERAWEDEARDDDYKFRKAVQARKSTRNMMAKDSMHLGDILSNVPDEALRIVEEEEKERSDRADAAAAEAADAGGDTEGSTPEKAAGPPAAHREDGGPSASSAEEHRRTETLQSVAEQLKAMQGHGATPSREGGYLMKAAAAFKKKQSTMTVNTSIEAHEPSTRTVQKKRDSDDIDQTEEHVPISAADEMVENLNKMYRLESKIKISDTTFSDLEAQQQVTSAASRWGKVRLAVNATAALSPSHEASAGDDGRGDGGKRTSFTASGAEYKKKAGYYMRCTRSMKFFKEIVQEVSSALRIKLFLTVVLGYVIIPSVFISAVLFYGAGNPMAGTDTAEDDPTKASYSWWLLFAGARQICTFSLSKITEIVMVDILTLKTRTLLRLLGPLVTLLVIQARGWPYILTFWAVWDFAILQGKHSFAMHWLYYSRISWFMECNEGRSAARLECNPAGDITYSPMYFHVLIAAIVLGATTAIKRALVAMYQGKRSTGQYGRQLEKLMARMVLISEVAHLAVEIEGAYAVEGGALYYGSPSSGLDYKRLRGLRHVDDSDGSDDDDDESKSTPSAPPSPKRSPSSENNSKRDAEDVLLERMTGTSMPSIGDNAVSTRSRLMSTGSELTKEGVCSRGGNQTHVSFGDTARIKLQELVGEWEEPTLMRGAKLQNISVQDVLQFRQARLLLDQKYPFSLSFGPARTRESCIESAQDVYERLLMHSPDSTLLPFDTLALIALDSQGEIDEKKARKLIKLFRPDREGYLTALDFVKSCDKVYKDLRTLRAAIANSSQIDHAFEQIVNVVFYFIIGLIVLNIMTIDAWALFLSLSGFILSFAFMFGSAASKYFEGILLILVQQPYDIGDRISLSNVQNDTSPNGSSTWFVEAVSLFATTVRFATTNEVATYSNGSLASSRIINSNRSPKAVVYIYNKFASDVPFEKVMIFKSVIESFVKERPREWLAMNGFRATRVEADLGFIEYVIVLQHVEKWQNIGPILNSKAEVSSYCLEVQKKLGMKYTAPPLPVNLGTSKEISEGLSMFEKEQIGDGEVPPSSDQPDFSALSNIFTKPEAKKTK